MKQFIAAACISTILFASPAFAYKRDIPPKAPTEESEEAPQQETEQEYKYESGGHGGGLVTMGYVLIGIGGVAVIAGSTIITATNKRLAGTIIDAGGGVVALTGSMMVLFGSRSGGYGLAPKIDPVHKNYGLIFAKNF